MTLRRKKATADVISDEDTKTMRAIDSHSTGVSEDSKTVPAVDSHPTGVSKACGPPRLTKQLTQSILTAAINLSDENVFPDDIENPLIKFAVGRHTSNQKRKQRSKALEDPNFMRYQTT
eukprot:813473_1